MKVIVGDYWRTVEMKKRFNEYSPMADKNLKQTAKKPFGELYPDRAAAMKIRQQIWCRHMANCMIRLSRGMRAAREKST